MPLPLIMVAPNGARRGKADHPALPVTIDEIVDTARKCHAAGADALHLHVRDAEGNHSLDVGLYRETLAELAKSVPSMRVQITTESAGLFDVPAQLSCLEGVAPSWASISVREIARNEELAPRIYATCADHGTEVQHILYDTADVEQLKQWRQSGVVREEQDSLLFVLGRYTTGQVSSPADLLPFREAAPDDRNWMVCAFGPSEHSCLLEAARLGGGLRVGFENSLSAADGGAHLDNAASVVALVKELERQSI